MKKIYLLISSATICLAFGLVSIWLGQDLNWDLRNYHLYAPYAFFNDRLGWDIAPAQIQTFINPFFDFPYYYFYSHQYSPLTTTFFMGFMHGITGVLLIYLGWIYFSCTPTPRQRILYVVISFLTGISGAAGFSIIGSTMIAWEPTALILLCLIFILKANTESYTRLRRNLYLVIAGLSLGISVGGKLTGGSYGLAIVFAFVVSQKLNRQNFKSLFLFIAGSGIGFLAISSLWGYKLYQLYDSPLFPFYNDIFKSSWAKLDALRDQRFLPRDIYQAIFYPFYWIKVNHSLVTELDFRDLRFPTIYVLYVLLLIKIVFLKFKRNKTQDKLDFNQKFILIYFIASYILWEKQFSIYRYLLPLEIISGLIYITLILYLIKNQKVQIILVGCIGFTLLTTTVHPDWGRHKFKDNYFFPSTHINIPENSLIVMAGGDALSFIIPHLNPSIRAISIENNFMNPDDQTKMVHLEQRIIQEFSGPIYSLTKIERGDTLNHLFKKFSLRINSTSCFNVPVYTDGDLKLCKLEKLTRN